jgi:hypothetical protein
MPSGVSLFLFTKIKKEDKAMNEKNPTPTKLEKARAKVEAIQREKEIYKHRLVRAKNRLQNTLKKQDSARTHRLIVEGAELEYVFDGIADLPQSTFRTFMEELSHLEGAGELFERMKTAGPIQEGGDD